MIGLWLESGRLALRSDLPEPEPAPGEARIRMLRAGICGTDLELLRGYARFTGTPGHEFVGVVEDGPGSWPGQRVVGEISAACRSCATCRAGRPGHCPRRTVLGIVSRPGVFAERFCLPAVNLHAVPDGLDDDTAVFTEPLAAALEVTRQIALGPGDRVLVAGDGRLGQLIARVLKGTGADLTVVGRHADKLDRLRRLGVAVARSTDVADASFDVAVECTGNRDGFALARRALRPRGSLVLKSTYADLLELDASSLVVDEITLIGSRCGPFAPALAMLARGDVPVRDLVSDRYPLDQALAAFEAAARPGALKVLLEPTA